MSVDPLFIIFFALHALWVHLSLYKIENDIIDTYNLVVELHNETLCTPTRVPTNEGGSNENI
jgi:hypothetical protein